MDRKDSPACTVSAPGRICLFGEHQDYLGLPVIAAAIGLRVEIAARPIKEAEFHVLLPDIDRELRLDPHQETAYTGERDYLRGGLNVLLREGLRWASGFEFTVRSKVPINSGASSSSALQIAWIAMLLHLAGDQRARDAAAVARLAHRSEVVEFSSPGGMMDHFASAIGGLIWLETAKPYRVESLPAWPGEFLLVDSGIPKDTNRVLGETRQRIEALKTQSNDSNALEPEERRLFEATRINTELTNRARDILLRSKDQAVLGQLLTEHHRQLSINLGVSVDEIDEMIDHGIAAGAFGGKINGSGGGGSFFFLCPGKGEKLQKMFASKGYRCWIVGIGEGLRIDDDEDDAPATPTAQ